MSCACIRNVFLEGQAEDRRLRPFGEVFLTGPFCHALAHAIAVDAPSGENDFDG